MLTELQSKQILLCSQCKISLQLVLDEGAPVHECEKCKGIWVDFVDEKALLQIKPEAFTVDELRRLRTLYKPLGKLEEARLRACPVCKELMYRRNWGGYSGVVVDRCEQHGTWYDEGEIEKIREYVQLGGVEFEKLRMSEQGFSEMESKLFKEVTRLDVRIDSAYRRARLWSLLGF